MWARIESGRVAEITNTAPAGRFHPSFVWVACDDWVRDGFKYEDGEFLEVPAVVPTPEEIKAAKVSLVQAHMDAAARALNYDSISNAITYAEEPAVPRFQAEGQALRAWRSLVWATCYEIVADIEAGVRDVPSDEELIAELPELVLPTM